MPDRASTWWAESTVPSTSFGSSSESTRSRPSSSENSRRQAVEGILAFSPELEERLVERAPARRVRGKRNRGILAVVQETLAHELLRASDVGGGGNGRGREGH